jgi:hypothetical protein
VKKDSHSYKIDRRMGPKQVTPEPDINFPKCTKVGWEINSGEEQIQRGYYWKKKILKVI